MEIETNLFRDSRGLSSSRSRDHRLAARAISQHGVVARRDLLELGFGSDQIQRMADARRLHRVHHGVYAVGHTVLTTHGRWMAAVLARGPDALLSHRSCGALANIHRTAIAYVEVTVPSQRAPIAGVRTYVSARLQPQDRDKIDGTPCTALARTLLDLATIVPRRQLERACDEAEVQELFDLRAVNDVLERSRGCRGAARRGSAPSWTSTRSARRSRAPVPRNARSPRSIAPACRARGSTSASPAAAASHRRSTSSGVASGSYSRPTAGASS